MTNASSPLLTVPMAIGTQTGPLMVMMHRLIASLVRCYAGEQRKLEIPTRVNVDETA